MCRRWLVGWLLALVGLLVLPAAVAAAPVSDLEALPAGLGKYVPGSAEWASSPWMTSPACADGAGDFSVWVAHVLRDTPSLLAFFQADLFGPDVAAEDRPRGEAIVAGYRALAVQLQVPPAYCVTDLRRWAGPDPAMRPFGFPWGVTFGGGHQTMYYCTDRGPDATTESERNRWFGAERAMCDGFYVDCGNAQQAEKQRCEAWNAFSDDYVRSVERLRAKAIAEHPASATAPTQFELKTPEEILREVAGNWFMELTLTISQGAAQLMAEAMTFWTRTDRTSMLTDPAVADIEGMLQYLGLSLLAGGMIWQSILIMIRRKPGPLISTGMGLLSYVGWSSLGGTLAILLSQGGVALSSQVLDQSIEHFSVRMGWAMQANIVTAPAAIFLLSLVLFLLACVLWVLGFFQMGALVILLALISTAAAGQLTERTKPWLPKVVGWCLALICYHPTAAVIFSIGFTLVGEGRNLETVMVGMAVVAMAVIAMPTMMRFFDWGGQQFVTAGGGGGGAMAAGAAASAFGGVGVGAFGRMMDQRGPASGGPPTGVAQVSAAHAGDGPGGGQRAPGGVAPTPARVSGAEPAGSTPAAAAGSGLGGGGASAGASAASATGAAGAAAGGVAAAAGPVGLAVVAAGQAKQQLDRGVTAVAGAMTPAGSQVQQP